MSKAKKVIAVFLIVIICIGCIPTAALAANTRDTSFAESLAADLKALGLFKGVSETNFDLAREPSRVEALVMLIRMLGKESEALNGAWKHPFTDVPSWADKYVAYAYEKGFTNGVSASSYGVGTANAAMYLTFVLRALGYSDTNGADFVWDSPFELSENVGILTDPVNTASFWRADVVLVSYAALTVQLKGSTRTLAQELIAAGVFTQVMFDSSYDANALENNDAGSILTAVQISEQCAPAVFYIKTYAFNGEAAGSGSGFFISEDGLAITNYHVAANSSVLTITTQDGKTYSDVKIIDADQENDLALLKINGTGFKYLQMGNSGTLKQGQQVYAIGSPLGLDNTMSLGIISNPSRTLSGVNYVQISVPIAPGSSGGALIDEYGKVVGVTSAGFVNSTGDLNLAIPINSAKALDKTSKKDYVLWNEVFYPSFSQVYDFGSFSGVELLGAARTPLGYILKYDAFDFNDVAGFEAGACYANTLFYYYEALLGQGFEQTEEADGYLGTFKTSTETVYVNVDLTEYKAIFVVAERVPQFYKEISKLPDLGWYIGIQSEDAYAVSGSLMYDYKWTDYYSYSDFLDTLYLYFELLEDQGFVYRGADNSSYLFEGNGLSVVYIIQDSSIYVDVAPL